MSGICVKITAASDVDGSNVEIYGEDISPISHCEEYTFGVTQESLKAAVQTSFGCWPDDVFLRGPTEWDLYNRYGWTEVQRVLRPVEARVIDITSEPVIVSRQEFSNNSEVNATFNAGISQTVETTVSSSWSVGGEISEGSEISVGISFQFLNASASKNTSYTSSWGQNTEHSHAVTVGSSSGVEVELGPGESVVAELTATRGTMQVEICYVATLEGQVAVNYSGKFKDHHFWGLPVNEILADAGLPTEVISTELMTIGFYSDAKVEIHR